MKRAAAMNFWPVGTDTVTGGALAILAIGIGTWGIVNDLLVGGTPTFKLGFDQATRFWWSNQIGSLQYPCGGTPLMSAFALVALWQYRRPSRGWWFLIVLAWLIFSATALGFSGFLFILRWTTMPTLLSFSYPAWVGHLSDAASVCVHAAFFSLLARRWWMGALIITSSIPTVGTNGFFEVVLVIPRPEYDLPRSMVAHAIVAAGFARWTYVMRRDALSGVNRCSACGYSLAGLPSAKCPECGHT